MKKILIISAIFLSCITVLIGVSTYNSLQKSEELVFNAWGDLDASLQRRADLIPNLVNTVKGYMQFEAKTLTSVVEARAKATAVHLDMQQLSNPEKMQKFVAAQNELQTSLGRLLVIAEKYPDLKANQSFMDLQHQLEGTENRINFARQQLIVATRNFNYAIRKFPGAIINNLFLRLERKEFFKAQANAEQVYEVDFSNS